MLADAAVVLRAVGLAKDACRRLHPFSMAIASRTKILILGELAQIITCGSVSFYRSRPLLGRQCPRRTMRTATGSRPGCRAEPSPQGIKTFDVEPTPPVPASASRTPQLLPGPLGFEAAIGWGVALRSHRSQTSRNRVRDRGGVQRTKQEQSRSPLSQPGVRSQPSRRVRRIWFEITNSEGRGDGSLRPP